MLQDVRAFQASAEYFEYTADFLMSAQIEGFDSSPYLDIDKKNSAILAEFFY